ncbi:hypothetical protein FEG63_01290 [Mycolicibacterium sphagni]|uniref:Acyl-protein synthetase LuxE domain-containing protein n=1 Tax=Mycolicibacterium sphagni TaxID=1786 RepID=A0ABX2JQU2_9MYCO|nr:hypothetical protein [Mycolicibacterium sphagni]NTY58184.1 hypothetical protein [Mycolicibacterium sphagni]
MRLRFEEDPYRYSAADILPLQLEAAQERLTAGLEHIPLLRRRAEDNEVGKLTESTDLVPLLFAHSAYKSYSESWLTDGRWDRMAKWLKTVATASLDGLDLDGVGDIDGFVDRLQTVGSYVTCSSGTTGKPALISCAAADLDIASEANVEGFSWSTGIAPAKDRKMFGLAPRTRVERNERTRLALIEAFATPENSYQLPLDPIGVGSIMAMIAFRRRVADGIASPSELAAFEEIGAQRQKQMDDAVSEAVDELIASRGQKLLLTGMFASLYQIAAGVRAKGLHGKDFRDDTAVLVGGGLKGAALPENYREFIFDTFNVAEGKVYHFYTMQELNTPFPKCVGGRYHVPPWVMMLPLDEPGERLLPTDQPVQGRAGFFDVSLDGRWGGVISGDRVDVSFAACECGHRSPNIGPDIVRYADLGGDKISCAGTIDAYVRGEA